TNPLSTFGADVDSAMYSNVRRMVMEEHRLPPPEAVRLEEFINYFAYDYPTPEKEDVMRPHFELGKAPWAPERKLLLIGLQAKMPEKEKLPPSHYVFLIDNSGSMDFVFPMVKEAMTVLAGALRKGDLVSMVTYGGGVEVLLEGCSEKETICKKIAALETGGYTPGGEGIQKAYALAEKHFIAGGNNRIVLITDGDFNVGASSEAELVEMVKAKRDTGIYLTIAGCGMGNYKDNKLKMLANKGNGNVFYLDTVREARRVFLHGMTGNMYALARDVKFQIEFNPQQVFAYRLLGYELRDMTDRDFRDDSKESGTVGLGQQMTALYEIIPADAAPSVKNAAVPEMPPLKYQSAGAKASEELLTFRIRYCPPQGRRTAKEETYALKTPLAPTVNWGWASAVAEAGLALRHSRFAPDCALEHAAGEAQKFLGEDRSGERAEFLLLLRRASELAGKEKKGK
ncbi:MAG: von Willebrand factor type A domain-containing protein, partial [Lentisphaeria bacterium]|nr:von Willebrand factor type A domain-containing protein [Lentisphaeria bacterium]